MKLPVETKELTSGGSWEPLPIPQVNGATALLATLVECGVDTIFGYPGGAVLPLYDALFHEPRLRHVLVRHEQAAVHAAEGYARSTGRVGVVLLPAMSAAARASCFGTSATVRVRGFDVQRTPCSNCREQLFKHNDRRRARTIANSSAAENERLSGMPRSSGTRATRQVRAHQLSTVGVRRHVDAHSREIL